MDRHGLITLHAKPKMTTSTATTTTTDEQHKQKNFPRRSSRAHTMTSVLFFAVIDVVTALKSATDTDVVEQIRS
jgi:hypothetical protein